MGAPFAPVMNNLAAIPSAGLRAVIGAAAGMDGCGILWLGFFAV